MENKESSRKAIAGGTGLVLSVVVLSIIPPGRHLAQPVVVPVPVIVPADTMQSSPSPFDSVLKVAQPLLENAKKLDRMASRPARKSNPTPARSLPQVSTIIVRTDSSVIEVPAKQYGSVAIVDGEDLSKALQAGDVENVYREDTMSQAAVEVANEQIGAWQWVKSLFKKRKHDKE